VLCLSFLNGSDDHITSNYELASVLLSLTIHKAQFHYSDLCSTGQVQNYWIF